MSDTENRVAAIIASHAITHNPANIRDWPALIRDLAAAIDGAGDEAEKRVVVAEQMAENIGRVSDELRGLLAVAETEKETE